MSKLENIDMEEVYQGFKKLVKDIGSIPTIDTKAPPLSKDQADEIDSYRSDPRRPLDYMTNIK
jgi:hypothetical protein